MVVTRTYTYTYIPATFISENYYVLYLLRIDFVDLEDFERF